MSDLKPWEAGYVSPAAVKVKTKKEAGQMGGLKSQSNKREGLEPKPAKDGTKKKGAKVTNVAKHEKFAAMTEEEIPLKKKLFLDKFIYEYVHDFNSSMAWIRAGGAPNSATSRGPESLKTGYVQTQLRILAEKLDEEQLVTRGEVILGIKKEAHYFGEDGSSSARVRAWGMLAKIKGMDVPKPIEPQDEGPRGGVMEVPMAATVVEWAEVAAASQLALKNDVRN